MQSVVLVTDGGELRSYSSQGSFLWDYYTRGRLSPIVSRSREGTSYISRTDGLLIALNRAGRELWQINMGSPLTHPVLIGWDGRLFIFTEDRITCITAGGFTLWSSLLEKRIVMEPFLDVMGGVVLVLEDGEVRRADPFGSFVSYVYIDRTQDLVPVTAATVLLENSIPTIVLFYENRQIELVYLDSGFRDANSNQSESLRGILELPSPPVMAAGRKSQFGNDEAAVLLSDGRIAIISLERRELLWALETHIYTGEIRNGSQDVSLIFDDRGIYTLSINGATAYSLQGERRWSIRLPGAASIPSFGDDGILYSGGTDWILYAYRMEDPVRARAGLMYGEEPPGIYGTGNYRPGSAFMFSLMDEREIQRRLSEIAYSIRNGNIGSRELEYISFLMDIAGVFIANPSFLTLPPVSVNHRAEAVRLLGFMGSRETIPFLTNVFNRDPSNNVKAQAALSIGRIGVDPEGLAIGAFTNALTPPNALTDEVVLTAIAEASGALSRFSGPPLSAEGIRILALLLEPDRPPATRRQALEEMRNF